MADVMFPGEYGAAYGRHGWMIVKGLCVKECHGDGVSIRAINTRGCSPGLSLDIPMDALDAVLRTIQDEKERIIERKRRKARPHDPPTMPDEAAV
jgi:hypothetical protein